MSGRPFAMVGVNGDETADEGRSLAAKNKINWRSVWDGGSRGTTATRWGVQGWPTSYLVDAKGVIRESNLRGDDLDKAVEAHPGGNRGREQPTRKEPARRRADAERRRSWRPPPAPGVKRGGHGFEADVTDHISVILARDRSYSIIIICFNQSLSDSWSMSSSGSTLHRPAHPSLYLIWIALGPIVPPEGRSGHAEPPPTGTRQIIRPSQGPGNSGSRQNPRGSLTHVMGKR